MLRHSKILLLSIFTIILLSSTYTALLPTADAAELNLETKTLSVLSEVVGLKTEQYTTTQSTQRESQCLDQPQKETDMYLASPESSLRVTCSYMKDTLQLLYLSDLEGQPSLKQPVTNTVDMAKSLLERYRNYAGNAFYSDLALMLNDVDPNKNVTKLAPDVKLEVSGDENARISYRWTYIDENGVVAERKNVILLYEGGQLKAFSNNWPFYTIADTTSKFSAKGATEMAIEASKNYSYKATYDNGTEIMVSGFTIAPESLGHAKLIYVNSKEQEYARGGDPYQMYLAWIVPLGFDKFYPGDVSGMTVIFWADTGQVCGINRVIVDSGPVSSDVAEAVVDDSVASPSIHQQSTTVPAATVVVIAAIGMVSLVTCKKARLVNNKISSKYWAVLLCATVMFSIMLSIPLANGESLTGRSRIYACVDTTSGYKNYPADQAEKAASIEICNYIGNASVDNGYITSNMYGSGTTSTNVINNALSDEQNYFDTVVFHVGHLYDFNTAYQDNWGNPIYANQILPQTALGRHFFTFIWVCVQAEDPTYGTPEAWTHRDDTPGHSHMDNDGFGTPDGNGQCYIGFYGFSPMVSTYYQSYEDSVFYEYNELGLDIGPAKWFIQKFYFYALYQGYSVRDSLDMASWDYFGIDYLGSCLNTGYNSWWPGGNWGGTTMPYLSDAGYFPMDYQDDLDPDRNPNRMRVFGDSNIKLYQPQLTLAASGGLSPSFTINGQSYSTGSHRLMSDVYTINVNDIPNYAFSHFNYKGTNYGRPANIQIASDGVLTAYYNWNPTYYTLSISSSGNGHTDPTGNQQCLSYDYKHVEAVPDAGWALGYWLKDGQSAGSNPSIDVYMDGPHTLQAVFVPAPTYKYVSSITGYGGPVSNPSNLVGPVNDGQYASMVGYGPYQVYGWVTGALNAQTSGHIYAYGYGGGLLYVYTSTDGSNWNLFSTPTASGSPGWIDCGTCTTPFSYMAFTAQDPNNIYSVNIDSVKVDSTLYTLTISSSGSGYTTPSGSPQYYINTYANVQAYAYSGYVFDHWVLDGSSAGNNPSINVYMNSAHSLQAVFVPIPPAYVASITGYDGAYNNPSGLVGSANDGQYGSIYAFWPYNVYGWISGALNAQTSGHIYAYGYGYGPTYVYTSTDNNNWNYVSTIYASGSPGWIDCGTYGSPFSYIKFYADYDTQLSIDSVQVQP